ncbi:hypothetical protein L1049_022187 [Liquidambar formosana]|uniref:F-box domain-containing protein n=1 Tax=Liquidambar formosana TaxID=63359 RepID=A0AAP0RC32_LIQFO
MESREFSSDIIFQILTRCSLETLGKCRLVCKEWNRITYESNFMRLHCEKTRTAVGYFIQSMSNNKHLSEIVSMDESNPISSLSLDFLPNPVKIEASSRQGLLYCVSQEPHSHGNHRIPQYLVCKPSTKQWQGIPKPKTQYFTQGSALMVLRLDPLVYKIVRFVKPKFWSKKCYDYRCEIFDSKIWAWKQSKEVGLQCALLGHEPAVLASGAIHWLTTDDHVFAFDPEEERWSMFPLPRPIHEKKLVEYKGKLALINMTRDKNMELWVMKDYGNRVWKKRTMSIEALRREEPHVSPEAFYNADIALMKTYDQVIFYKFQNHSSNVVKLKKNGHPCQVFTFQSDFQPSDMIMGY